MCFEFGRIKKFVDLRKKRFGLTMVAGVLGIDFVFFFAKFRRFMFIVAFGFLENEKRKENDILVLVTQHVVCELSC